MRNSIFATAIVVSLGLAPAQALMLPIEEKELAKEAQIIVHGTITQVRSAWEKKTIYTYATLAPTEILKNTTIKKPKEIQIRLPGGTVGDTTLEVSDTPTFTVGEDVLVCLKPDGPYFKVVGEHQGKFVLKKSKAASLSLQGLKAKERFRELLQEPSAHEK